MKPEQIAAAISFLASDEAPVVTGRALLANEGFSAAHQLELG